MKTRLLALPLLMLTLIPLKSSALPSEETPLLQKLLTPGFIRPEFQVSQNCQIFADHVQILHGAGEARAVEVKKISLDTQVIRRLVAAASKGNITRTPAPSDMPTTRYLGDETAGTTKTVPLKSTGSEVLANDAAEATSLINLIDALCK